ncbi:MAG: nucleoside hydrolase [Erysipelotrichaceae bacterium]|nr:nucleoside hydrolase [Erysipelotrichaceae bacterium]
MRKVILDVDTGSDDAVAIVTAGFSPDIELIALCTVWGNLPIEVTTDNTLRVVSAFGLDVPVYRGCDRPLVKDLLKDYPPKKLRRLTDENGQPLAMHTPNMGLPPTDRQMEDLPAAMFYVDYLRKAREKVTVVLVGPLTNFALALRIDPGIIENVEEVVIMGGGHDFANARPCAEANIWNDPEAAQIVLECGGRVVFVPLDATHRAYITIDDCRRMRQIGSPAAVFCAEQITQRIKVHTLTQPLEAPDSAAVHDPLAIAYLIDPQVLSDLRNVHMSIGQGGPGEGQTIIDSRYYTQKKNCWFAFNGDRDRFAEILLSVLENSRRS